MKTITISITISEEIQQPLTIKSSIQERIAYHLIEKEKAIKLTEEIKKESKKALGEILLGLNEKVGESVWCHVQNLPRIKFKANTIEAVFDQERVEFGNIVYYKPILDSLTFRLIHCNRSMYRPDVVEFVSIDQVNSILEKDYIEYFTSK